MAPDWKSFIQARSILRDARRELLAGSPERALDRLRDPAVALSREADRLRASTLDALCRQAVDRAGNGRAESVARILRRVASEDPGLARDCRERLAHVARAAMPAPGRARDDCFRLAVDEGGEYLVCTRESLVIGHSRSLAADLPFLADVGARHARLERRESLRGGVVWHLRPLEREPVWVGDRRVDEDGAPLAPGVPARLSTNLVFRLRVPDPASESCVLELLKNTECAGAQRILLFAPGVGGRVRIGPARHRHVRVASEHDVSLIASGEKLVVASSSGLRVGATEPDPPHTVELDHPPPRRVDVAVGRAAGGSPPFTLSFAPVEFVGGVESAGGEP